MLTHAEFKNRIRSHEKPEFCMTITEPFSPSIYLEASVQMFYVVLYKFPWVLYLVL